MNRKRQRAMFARVSLLVIVIVAWGCQAALPPKEFIKSYERKASATSTSGGYKFTALLMSPEYILAKQWDTTWTQSQIAAFKNEYQNAYYLSLQISQTNPTGGPEDLQKDLVGSALIQGANIYQTRLKFLESELAAYVSLECSNGKKVSPLSYRFQRGYGLGGAHTFLFLFPKLDGGTPIEIRDGHFVLRDFGLNTGTLKINVRMVPTMALRV